MYCTKGSSLFTNKWTRSRSMITKSKKSLVQETDGLYIHNQNIPSVNSGLGRLRVLWALYSWLSSRRYSEWLAAKTLSSD